MPSLHSLSLNLKNKKPGLTAWLTWIARIIFGATFIVSGFVKAVDPWGTVYKLEEYFSALGVPLLHSLIVLAAFGLFTVEFLIGVFFLFGCYRRSNPWLGLIFMCVMLPLTLWIAIKNPVADCGCFGDAFILSNWDTFYKNVVLTIIAIWLILFNTSAKSLISPAFQWICAVASVGFIIVISLYGYKVQPLIDFRDYKVGTPLLSEDNAAVESSYIFVYEKEGKQVSVREDDELPDEEDGWVFVKRIEQSHTGASISDTKSFRLWDSDSEEDVSEELLPSGKIMLLLMPDLGSISPASTWRINQLYDSNTKAGIKTIGVVDASQEVIDAWSDLSIPQYPIYTADDTAIKEVARGNPAVVYLVDGIVRFKSSMNALDLSTAPNANIEDISNNFEVDRKLILYSILVYTGSLIFLIALSLIPIIRKAF